MSSEQKKCDGHTHTQFCPHAKIDSTADLIEKAIASGFTEYSITEHPPLPPAMLENDPEDLADYSMGEKDVPDYLQHVRELQKTYRDQIRIRCGFEFEYFPTGSEYTKQLIAEYRGAIEDSLISLHFLPAGKGLKMLDFSPEYRTKNLLKEYGSEEKIHMAYWEAILQMIEEDFGDCGMRIGHLGLIYKFIKKLPISSEAMHRSYQFLEQKIFPRLQKKGKSLDFNVRGISQSLYGRCYLDQQMLNLAKSFQIPLVYGSDAHHTDDVGEYYDFFEANTCIDSNSIRYSK